MADKAAAKIEAKIEGKVSLGPTVREGEEVFAVAPWGDLQRQT
jgi:hypothetical protein